MAKVKVRHALVTWTTERNGQTVTETAFRNMVVDIPASQADKLREAGAVVEVDEELALPGTPVALPVAASNEEILNWAAHATPTEIQVQVQNRPQLAERLRAAYEEVQKRLQDQNEILGGIVEQAEAVAEEAGNSDDSNQVPTTAAQQAAAEPNDEEMDRVVQGNVDEVSKYLSENPHHADAILQAEQRRATADQKNPRQGVIEAARAASSSSSLL
jgi:hypothetical protein